MKVYYIIPLNYHLTGNPENFKMKLYYLHLFQERLFKKEYFKKVSDIT